ncbi:MAG: M23 family metallopeptidase [Chloroflexi bacterium]|nr:M23 family metallopeptidase [Chloroflexota bacterium]
MNYKRSIWVLGLLLFWALPKGVGAQAAAAAPTHTILPGDTWTALSYRYGRDVQATNRHMNRQRQPAIGTAVALPPDSAGQMGVLLRSDDGGLLATAVRHNTDPWAIALQNDLPSPYRPLMYQPIFLPGGEAPPRDLPEGFAGLELSQPVGEPGVALGWRTEVSETAVVSATLNSAPFVVVGNGRYRVGLIGTGAFYGRGEPNLNIQVDDGPLWSQPWRFEDRGDWVFQELTYTGTAAAITQDDIDAERARLREIWSQVTPQPYWTAPFTLPIANYLSVTSTYGDRRSVNGGPYNRYHEGVDFSAYGGTPVLAPAAGRVVVAEVLAVRGGAVILDHGLGIYSGYYHLSDIMVEPGQMVQAGEVVGAVGTTGLSTGNHLHWDMLVGITWVDGQAWLAQDMACWIRAALGAACE